MNGFLEDTATVYPYPASASRSELGSEAPSRCHHLGGPRERSSHHCHRTAVRYSHVLAAARLVVLYTYRIGCLFHGTLSYAMSAHEKQEVSNVEFARPKESSNAHGPIASVALGHKSLEDERRLVRKLDMRILPLISSLYLFACASTEHLLVVELPFLITLETVRPRQGQLRQRPPTRTARGRSRRRPYRRSL